MLYQQGRSGGGGSGCRYMKDFKDGWHVKTEFPQAVRRGTAEERPVFVGGACRFNRAAGGAALFSWNAGRGA
ncbi:MAG: hypothetical protein Kow0059_05760 [Candidatus Sumerlaeia bacterium]